MIVTPSRALLTAMPAAMLLLVTMVAAGCQQGNVFSLKIGDCFDGVAAGEVSDVNKVDCTASHDSEVFSVSDYPNAPSAFPGATAMNTATSDRCVADFKAFVGIDAAASQTYTIGQLVPTADSWASGDRQLVCIIAPLAAGHKLTGSAKGTAK
jgi:Septum formation